MHKAGSRIVAALVAGGLVATVWMSFGGGLLESAQTNSPLPTSPLPTATPETPRETVPPSTVTPTSPAILTDTPRPTDGGATATPGGAPDMNATSTAVIATITALAASPTFPPTATRRPVGSAGDGAAPTTPTPTTPQPEGIALLSISSQVYRGGAATLVVRAQPGDVCALRLARREIGGEPVEVTPQPPGMTRQLDAEGTAAWIWEVTRDAPTGTWIAEVSCRRSGSVRYDVEVLP